MTEIRKAFIALFLLFVLLDLLADFNALIIINIEFRRQITRVLARLIGNCMRLENVLAILTLRLENVLAIFTITL